MVGFELVLNSKKPHAFISTRDQLIYSTIKVPSNRYYIPPQNEETSFFADTMSMVMHKNFSYIKEFDNL